MKEKYLIGIDEVGRGPLAGPVAVGAVMMKMTTYHRLRKLEIFPAGKDSKKLTPTERLFYFQKIKKLQQDGKLNYAVSFCRHTTIDKIGIVKSVARATRFSLVKLNPQPKETMILLDGGLKAPAVFQYQKTIIRGDEQELIIALASITAKVTRDRQMVELAKIFTPYHFASNKGYGSKDHIRALKKYGPCDIHRCSYTRHFR